MGSSGSGTGKLTPLFLIETTRKITESEREIVEFKSENTKYVITWWAIYSGFCQET